MNSVTQQYQLLIIGSGPSGLSAAATAHKLGLSYCLLEAADKIANTLQSFSRNKQVMAEPAQLPLRADLPFQASSKEQILQQWQTEAEAQAFNIRFNSKVIAIEGQYPKIHVTLHNGKILQSRTLLLCLGQQGNPRTLNIANKHSQFISHFLPEPHICKNQQVCIVGAGDSAIEDALNLCQHASVTLINRGKDFPKAKPANRSLVLKAIEQGLIHHIEDSHITVLNEDSGQRGQCLISIQQKNHHTLATQHAHKIITRLGAVSPRAFMQSAGIAFDGDDEQSLPTLDKHYQSSVKGLFILGALSGNPLIKQAMNQGYDCVSLLAGKEKIPVENQIIEQKLRQQDIHSNLNDFIRLLQQQNKLFEALSFLDIRELLLQSSFHHHVANTTIFDDKQFSDELHILLTGRVTLEANKALRDQESKQFNVPTGGLFGESAMLTGQPHGVTAVSQGQTLILSIPGYVMRKLMAKHRSIQQQVHDVFKLRYISWFLACDLPSNMLQLFLNDIEWLQLEKGQLLLSQSQIPEHFYLVRNGALTSSHSRTPDSPPATDRRPLVDNFYNSGQSIAAYETLHGLAMSDDIKASVKSSVIRIPQKILLSLLDISNHFKQLIQQSEQQRLTLQQQLQSDHSSAQALSFFMQQGLGEAGDVLLINKSQCIACDMCETACAATHQGNSRLDRKAGSVFQQYHIPSSCRHCEQPKCMTDCPSNAIQRQESGEIIIDDSCIGCGNCVSHCDYGVISLIAEKKQSTLLTTWWNQLISSDKSKDNGDAVNAMAKAVKCDLCSNTKTGPACVSACPTGAAQRIKSTELFQFVQPR